ncbi:YeeE/YedE family protein [Amycolatopsis sp. FBCC-B4732]|uniref:YeeE/YedE thiosulfate transporter family protein n=1 Tax=Amycolatopsis sp. FBCC-B4732 TaxID=3079339 RepID=UPI001FF52C76|nr:YeeE/YedE thiosulfate transporter family protein [Amycolatopsis sp. FBCC-B4732]UOX93531.1 YeeE/YedE family protein [Amycolatopsis sp. FBCC-B4732]
MGYVLQRAQLCFHATFAGALTGRFRLARSWLLGVAIAAAGLSVLFLTPLAGGLDEGLPFTPVADVVGGLVIGVGMAVASTCVSGLFFKLGSGMLGCLAGLGGWAVGELSAREVVLPGPTLLPPGPAATVPALLGIPRVAFAFAFLAAVVAALGLWRHADHPRRGQWNWPVAGVALGVVTIVGWVLAGAGGASFGPSTVGAVTGLATGEPNWWLTAFLPGIVLGGAIAARVTGGLRVRSERRVRYVRLVVGGFLLGAGGWLAGGCTLGHGLSGVAQLNVSSWVVVAAVIGGIALARGARIVLAGTPEHR